LCGKCALPAGSRASHQDPHLPDHGSTQRFQGDRRAGAEPRLLPRRDESARSGHVAAFGGRQATKPDRVLGHVQKHNIVSCSCRVGSVSPPFLMKLAATGSPGQARR
jgi:hypothetical protein